MTIDKIIDTTVKSGAVAATCVGATLAITYGIEALISNSITPAAIGLTAVSVGGLYHLRKYIREDYIPTTSSSSIFERAIAGGFLGVTTATGIISLSTISAVASQFFVYPGRQFSDILSYAGLLAGSYALAESTLATGKKWLNLSPIPKIVSIGTLALVTGLGHATYSSEHTTPGHTASGHTAPEYAASEHTVPEEITFEDDQGGMEQESLIESGYIEDRGYDDKNSSFTIDSWPVDNPQHVVSSCFGYRGELIGRTLHSIHNAVDIRAKKGTAVFSISEGTVENTDKSVWGSVRINSGGGYSVNYLHLDTIAVQKGDYIEKGQVIGTVGGRGPRGIDDFKPHLHLEMIDTNLPLVLLDSQDNSAVLQQRANPLCYMDPALTYKMIQNKGCISQGGWAKFCDAYHTFSADTTTTTSKLEQIQLAYSPIVEPAVAGTSMDPSFIYAIIMKESRGNIFAFSPDRKYVGLLQLSPEVAFTYGACDENCKKDERTDPEHAISAGVAYLEDVGLPYTNYEAQDELRLIAYNAGPAVAQALALETGNIPWSEMRCELTESLLADVYEQTREPSLRTAKQRKRKSEIIQEYVDNAITYQKKFE